MSTITVSGYKLVSTAVTNAYYVKNGGTLTISHSGTISASNASAVIWDEHSQANATIINTGLILAANTKGRAFDTAGPATAGETASNLTLINAGTVIAGADAFRDQYVNGGGVIAITNTGTIAAGTTLKSGAVNGRAFNFQQDLPTALAGGGSIASFSLLSINNTGLIVSADDAIRATSSYSTGKTFGTYVNPTFSGTIAITNSGTIESIGSSATGLASAAGSGQGIDFHDINAANGHVVITNRAGGLIKATDNDAIRPGNNGIVINYGSIYGGQYITSANKADPAFQAGSAGVSATDNEVITVTNYGTIEGAKSGVFGSRNPATEVLASDETMTAGAPSLSSNVIVNNEAGGVIIGDDGKAVGADFGRVYNAGTIIGKDNATLLRGDGDGIDINFTAFVTNAAGGVIEALGSEGVDDNGRKNVADGLAIGGGTVDNAGKIFSANNGVTVNNDGNPDGSRSGNADLVLTNEVGGVIEADGGYAIRSENKAGLDQANVSISSVDYDTVTNYGTILSYGTIPNFADTFTAYATTVVGGVITLEPGTYVADPNVTGTIEGTVYSSSDAGSIRFTRGDGSAIQLGEGNDILNEYGVLYAQDGRAINLEGGNNTLNLFAGASITGRIDGGHGGSNTLDLNTPNGAGATPGASAGTLDNIIDFSTLNIAGGAWTLEDAETYAASISIASGAALIVGSGADLATSGSIHGALSLTGTGVIDLLNLSFSGTTHGVIGGDGVVTITQGASSETVTFAAAMAGETVLFANDGTGGTDVTLCFYAGTRIATPDGEVAVETLRAGQAVLTANGARMVRWVGQSQVDMRFADRLRSLPIRIRAGALGGGLPRRDLRLSPDHAVFLGGILVQAGALVNGSTIVRDYGVPEQFTYYHVELESHELLMAEGALAESFVDNVERMHFHNWDGRDAPASPIAEMELPRVKSARQLPPGLRALLAA